MIVARSFEADQINGIANHPDVRPWIAPPECHEVDLSGAVADRRNVLLMAQGGGFFFFFCEPGIFEAHPIFLPEARGDRVLAAAREAVLWMFDNSSCEEIIAPAPIANLRARALATRLGMVPYERVTLPVPFSPFLMYSLRREGLPSRPRL